jgi:hypothetical protein
VVSLAYPDEKRRAAVRTSTRKEENAGMDSIENDIAVCEGHDQEESAPEPLHADHVGSPQARPEDTNAKPWAAHLKRIIWGDGDGACFDCPRPKADKEAPKKILVETAGEIYVALKVRAAEADRAIARASRGGRKLRRKTLEWRATSRSMAEEILRTEASLTPGGRANPRLTPSGLARQIRPKLVAAGYSLGEEAIRKDVSKFLVRKPL